MNSLSCCVFFLKKENIGGVLLGVILGLVSFFLSFYSHAHAHTLPFHQSSCFHIFFIFYFSGETFSACRDLLLFYRYYGKTGVSSSSFPNLLILSPCACVPASLVLSTVSQVQRVCMCVAFVQTICAFLPPELSLSLYIASFAYLFRYSRHFSCFFQCRFLENTSSSRK